MKHKLKEEIRAWCASHMREKIEVIHVDGGASADLPPCPQCSGATPTFLGILVQPSWRCRDCGWTYFTEEGEGE